MLPTLLLLLLLLPLLLLLLLLFQRCKLAICKPPGLQNAMTSSRERTSTKAESYRIERSPMGCVGMQSISYLEQILGC